MTIFTGNPGAGAGAGLQVLRLLVPPPEPLPPPGAAVHGRVVRESPRHENAQPQRQGGLPAVRPSHLQAGLSQTGLFDML